MKVIVCQHGARRRYAVARILEEAGMLAALYTDSCEYSPLGKFAKAVGPLAKGSIERLANRRIEGIPRSKVFSSDIVTIYSILHAMKKVDPEVKWQQLLSRRMMKWSKNGNNIIYNMYCENLLFMKYAKHQKAKVVVDVYMNPFTNQIINDEYNRLGQSRALPQAISAVSLQRVKETFDLSDVLLCPSMWVADGVRELCPQHARKIRICPYGSSIDYAQRTNKPIKGRVFWAGRNWLGKGLHHLAQAADELKTRYPEMDFRAAGITNAEVTKMPCFRNVTFIGKLDEKQMKREFLFADAFVFPTLSEGMSGVILEAIAAGCPVITTRFIGIDAIENG